MEKRLQDDVVKPAASLWVSDIMLAKEVAVAFVSALLVES